MQDVTCNPAPRVYITMASSGGCCQDSKLSSFLNAACSEVVMALGIIAVSRIGAIQVE
jgi:hypothetical protein